MAENPNMDSPGVNVGVVVQGLREIIKKHETSRRSLERLRIGVAIFFFLWFCVSTLPFEFDFSLAEATTKMLALVFLIGITSSPWLFLAFREITKLKRTRIRQLAQLSRLYQVASRIVDLGPKYDTATRVVLEIELTEAGIILGQHEGARALIDIPTTPAAATELEPSTPFPD